jgi:sugar-specific transcriptional regulator TrmB
MDNFEERLRKSGLTGNEAKIYLELLRKGSLSANDLSKKIGMDRTLTYTVLNHLIEKGLVNYVIKKNKKFFEAADPANLLNPIKEKEAFVNDLVPELRKVEKIKEIVQEINIYEGKEGLRTFMRELLKYRSFCSFGSTGRAYDALYEVPRLAKELEKKGFSARIISNPKYKKHEMTKLKNIQFRYLDIKSEATTSIFGDNIAIHLLTEKPIIILIKNKEIAESYHNHFEILWNVAKKL